jgi:MFS family permease
VPALAQADVRRLVLTRSLRGLADGAVSVLLADHLSKLGMSAVQIGALVTGTLLGSAALTIALGLLGHRLRIKPVLLSACALMVATAAGFAAFTQFWPLFIVAVVGTINPSAGDVSVFLPAEQAALSNAVGPADRTEAFAWYNLGGSFAGALGALCAAVLRGLTAFALYAAVGLACALVYARLSSAAEHAAARRAVPLERSRRVVLELAALFSLDSFGGGFAVQTLLVYWLERRHGIPIATSGAIFFASGIAAAVSQFVSGRLAARIGHVRTMVFTHLPANLFLMLAGVMPSATLAVTFLLLRSCLSSMDVPARQAYVMSVVPPEERAAAASVTNVPRSLASAIPPLFSGALLQASVVGWPLVIAGGLKAAYDLILLARFRAVRPLEEDR